MSNDFWFSFRSVAREIIKEDGIGRNGLLGKGITGTMGRNGFFNMIYFGFYHTMKNWLPASSDSRLEFCRKVMLGLTAGTLGCCVNIPFDVAKSRIQGDNNYNLNKMDLLRSQAWPSLYCWNCHFFERNFLTFGTIIYCLFIPFSLFPISPYPMLSLARKCRWWMYCSIGYMHG